MAIRTQGLKLSITEGEKKERARQSLPASVRRRGFRNGAKKGGVVLASSVETLGVDLRTRPKQVGDKARGTQCDVGFSVIGENRVFQKNYMRTGMRKLLRTGLVLARAWEGQAVGIAPTDRLKLRREMAAAAGKKESVPLSLFMEVNNLEIEKELSTMATLAWTEGVRLGRMEKRAAEGLEEADLRSTDLETSGRTGRSSHMRDFVIWASSGHSDSTPCCLKGRWWWT